MITERLNANNINDIKRAATIINAGGVVAFPTETVYGLGALGLSPLSIEKIFLAKSRPSNNPLIQHVASFEQAKLLWNVDNDVIAKRALDLYENFWPGPLTIVNYKAPHVPYAATANLNKVAVRFPSHHIAQELLKLCTEPLVAPSANLSNRPSPTTAEHVIRTLNGKIEAVLDGGACSFGIESTVIDITESEPIILRPGALCFDEIKKVLPNVIQSSNHHHNTQSASPGCFKKHYAPLIEQRFTGDKKDVFAVWSNSDYALLLRESTFKSLFTQHGARPQNAYTAVMSDSAQIYSTQLYHELYRLEESGKKKALIESTPALSGWDAIHDRITRAVA